MPPTVRKQVSLGEANRPGVQKKPNPAKARPGKKSAARRPAASSLLGKTIVGGLEDLLATMRAGGMPAVEKKFTVRRVKRVTFDRPVFRGPDVAAIRAALGVSQPVFAALLGVSPNTVRAWEQGVNPPSRMAARFLAEIRNNPEYWKAQVRAAAGEA
jgi:DNA-binding transcriptional regulator YiaG